MTETTDRDSRFLNTTLVRYYTKNHPAIIDYRMIGKYEQMHNGVFALAEIRNGCMVGLEENFAFSKEELKMKLTLRGLRVGKRMSNWSNFFFEFDTEEI